MTDARIDQSLASTNGQVGKISIASHEGHWVATLSDGTTAVEKQGQWSMKSGERLPWVRLCYFAADNDLHLTSLRFNYKGRTIHLPRERFAKFSMEDRSRAPSHYSVQYHLEVDDLLSGSADDTMFVDLAAHYDDFAVHYIQDMTNGNDSWIVVTDPNALAPSPRRLT
jgi:hypothetical protein